MKRNTNRRDFIQNATLAAGVLAVSGTTGRPAEPTQCAREPFGLSAVSTGAGGPLGSATDRGKLVPGLRKPSEPPVPVTTPDLAKLTPVMKDGVKEFYLHATPHRREFLPDAWMDVWGYNDSMPGPTIEVTEGDRVRLIMHNMLPEPTVLHLHGLELPNRIDGVHGVTQEPIKPGEKAVYEFTLHQNGTFFYHSHGPMQAGLGMAGLFIIHPRSAYQPVVDHDFALMIQEWAILPQSTIPNVTSMEFNWFTLNGRSAPYITPLLVRLGSRVRIRFVNMSSIDHHPMHLHGHTFWITGTEAGRIPETAWIPSNNVLVGVAQAREIEFIANNPGDWVLHCHMFHHMMNHMAVMVGPMGGDSRGGMKAGMNGQAGMGMTQGGPALSRENGPSLGRGMGENTGIERTVPTMPLNMEPKKQGPGGHEGHEGHEGHGSKEARKVPGYPADMMDMMGIYSEAEIKKLNKPETRACAAAGSPASKRCTPIVRVLPSELYDKVISGKGDIEPGASVPGGGPGELPGSHEHHH